jgi:uncharacterized membrane protein YgcG
MKKLTFTIILIALFTFGFNGCYTIIWTPDSAFPTEDNSTTNIYYGDTYYGDYYYFYDYPWWLDIVPPVAGNVTTPRSDRGDVSKLRNTGERGTPPRTPELQPVSQNAPPADINNTGSSDNSGNKSTETSVRSSSSSSTSSSGRESSSSSGSTVRNNNGGRSSGGRK